MKQSGVKWDSDTQERMAQEISRYIRVKLRLIEVNATCRYLKNRPVKVLCGRYLSGGTGGECKRGTCTSGTFSKSTNELNCVLHWLISGEIQNSSRYILSKQEGTV
jgi:hypothetical protein